MRQSTATLILSVLMTTPALSQDLAAITWTGQLMRLDAATGAVLSSMPSGLTEVNGAARTPGGKWWVAADRGARIVELDPVTGTQGVSIPTTLNIRGMAAHPVTGDLYVAATARRLIKIDPNTGAETQIAASGLVVSGVQSLEFTPDGRLWAWSITQSTVTNDLWELDPNTGLTLQHIADPGMTLERHQFLTSKLDGTFLVGNNELWQVDPTTGIETLLGTPGGDIRGADLIEDRGIGSNYCGPTAVNSTGQRANLSAYGSSTASANQLWLGCSGLPAQSFGFFLTSESTDFVPHPGGSQGNLCLGGSIGRLVNQIVSTGPGSSVSIPLDLLHIPTPNGTVPAVAGATRHFTYWYRDANPGVTSNLGDGLTVTFQ